MLVHVLGEERRALAEHDTRQVAREAAVQVDERRHEDVVGRAHLGSAGGSDRWRGASVRSPRPGRHRPPSERTRIIRASVSLNSDWASWRPSSCDVLDPLGGELRSQPLELGAHLVRIPDLARRRPPHEGPAIGLQLDEAARLELPERLADRRSTDAELLGERLLPEPRPRDELAAHHARLQRRARACRRAPTDPPRRASRKPCSWTQAVAHQLDADDRHEAGEHDAKRGCR